MSAAVFSVLCTLGGAGAGLGLYSAVPGLPPSPYYSLRARQAGTEQWRTAFTLVTQCTAATHCNTTGAWQHIAGWR